MTPHGLVALHIHFRFLTHSIILDYQLYSEAPFGSPSTDWKFLAVVDDRVPFGRTKHFNPCIER